MTRDPYANVTAAYRDAWARNTAALVLLTPPLRDRFRSLIAAVTDLAGAMGPHVEHYRRHHPAPMPPGVVTWNPRRRRTRRKAHR